MSRTAGWTTSRRGSRARQQRYIACSLLGAVVLAALSLMGYGLLPPRIQDRPTPVIPVGQPVSNRQVAALLAQAQAHDPLLRLPHARWFIRVRHGHDQVIVVDHAPLQDGSTGAGIGREQQ